MAGYCFAAAGRYVSNSPRFSSRKVLTISLFQKTSQRGRSDSASSSLVSPTVLVDSASNFGSTRNPKSRCTSAKMGLENSESSDV